RLVKPKPNEYPFDLGGRFVTFHVPEGITESEHACPWPRKGLQRGSTGGVEGLIVLGQEQDAFGGGFAPHESSVGEMSAMDMWDTGI
ncbi:PREDICTED: C-reactive protein-like, partial [Merops nubicus]|uniref:C-reactive protein-like n=1 Tax=Merops nubicus TaxID=57421 RepID=UPI0004F08B51